MIFRFVAVLMLGLSTNTGWGSEDGRQVTIDSILASCYAERDIEPLPSCDDLQFLRRASLDLIGRVPTLEEIERFERDPDRESLIHQLVDSPDFDRFLSEVWTGWLVGYSNEFNTDREVLRQWLESQIRSGKSYQMIVQQLIDAEGSVAIDGPSNYLVRHRELPAIHVSRSFLGVRLECAQCHDHPFDRWTQEDYRRMNQFFASMQVVERNRTALLRDEPIQFEEDERPRFLTGSVPRTAELRKELALFITNCKPFARTFVNRTWYHLIGRGIIDPPDDHNQENPPVSRALLEYLADQTREQDFQIKPLFKLICQSKAYQRQCATGETSDRDRALFAARQVKPLLPEQYVDSFNLICGASLDSLDRRLAIQNLIGETRLLEDYQRTWEYRETDQQLMQKIAANLPRQKQSGKVDLNRLFLQILTRYPSDSERATCRGMSRADITFALVFGNEFFFNH